MLKMEKIHLYDKILSPLVTEKSTNLSEQNKIVFKVPSKANKKNIKSNIEKNLICLHPLKELNMIQTDIVTLC